MRWGNSQDLAEGDAADRLLRVVAAVLCKSNAGWLSANLRCPYGLEMERIGKHAGDDSRNLRALPQAALLDCLSDAEQRHRCRRYCPGSLCPLASGRRC